MSPDSILSYDDMRNMEPHLADVCGTHGPYRGKVCVECATALREYIAFRFPLPPRPTLWQRLRLWLR